jgi:DNA-binding MarR family transcriptional regulator
MAMIRKLDDDAVQPGLLTELIGYNLRRAQVAVFEDFHRILESEDIRAAQFAILEILRRNPGLRQTQAGAALGVKTANFGPMFDGLERRGLVERRVIAGDRRAKGLFLTDAGTQMLGRLDDLVTAHERRFAARLGVDGKSQLLGLLHRLSDPAFDTSS